MTHADLIQRSLLAVDLTTPSGIKHERAWADTYQHPVVAIIKGLARYADMHAKQYENGIGEDGVLGNAWADGLRAVRELLNGETGNLDCGTTDGLICAMLRLEGFEI